MTNLIISDDKKINIRHEGLLRQHILNMLTTILSFRLLKIFVKEHPLKFIYVVCLYRYIGSTSKSIVGNSQHKVRR